MARKTNETKAREACALHNVDVNYEAGNGVELWGRDTHTCTDAGVHSDYFPRENYRSDAAMWADVATVATTFKPCADDCECRAMTICGVCGNAGNVADFMETHTCVSRETTDWEMALLAPAPEVAESAYPANSKCNDDNYVGTCLQCGSTFHAATPENIAAAQQFALVCCETPIVDCELNDYSQCPICLDPIDYCLGHGSIDPTYLEGN